MIEFWKFFHRYEKKCEKLSDQELGRLVRALNHYSMTGERQELAGRESIAFDFIADDIDQNQSAYIEKCEKNRANAAERTQANGSERKRTVANGSERSQAEAEAEAKAKAKVSSNEDTKADAFADFAGDNNELLQALTEFEEMRKKIKKPMTDRAKTMLINKLKQYPAGTAVQMLYQSINHCWADVYDLKTDAKQEPENGRAAVSYDLTAAEDQAAQGAPVYRRRGGI